MRAARHAGHHTIDIHDVTDPAFERLGSGGQVKVLVVCGPDA
jgi:hypothetical protein